MAPSSGAENWRRQTEAAAACPEEGRAADKREDGQEAEMAAVVPETAHWAVGGEEATREEARAGAERVRRAEREAAARHRCIGAQWSSRAKSKWRT